MKTFSEKILNGLFTNDNFLLVERIYHNRVSELPIFTSSLLTDALVRAKTQIYLIKAECSELTYSQIESYSNKFSEALELTIKKFKDLSL
jgi:hypothetical protein